MATLMATQSPPPLALPHSPRLLFSPSMDPNNMAALTRKVAAGMMEQSNARLVCLLCLFALFACLLNILGRLVEYFSFIIDTGVR